MQKIPHAIFITDKANIRYFSNFQGTAGYLVLMGKSGWLFTDSRYHLVAKKVLPQHIALVDTTGGFDEAWKKFLRRHRMKTIGVEAACLSHALYLRLKKLSPGVDFIDVGRRLAEQRMQKSKKELALIEKAQSITDRVFAALVEFLKPGLSERDIAWQSEVLAHDFGGDGLSFPSIVAINENSASPHHQCSDRKLRRGDMVLIDMGVSFGGYCSDMTRVIFTKQPTSEERYVYETVLAAQRQAIQHLRPGITGKAADSAARDVIIKAGYGSKFTHSLGHGVGLEVHELPTLSQKYSGKIPLHAVVTCEPGIYLPGTFGIRLEDMVVVEQKKARVLTQSSKALTIVRL